MLYLYWRVAFGVQKNADAAAMPDLDLREWLMLGPIAAAVLWMGVYPESFLAPMRADIAALDARIARAKPEGRCAAQDRCKPASQGRRARSACRGGALMDFAASLQLILPEIVLSVAGLVLLLVAAWAGDKASRAISVAACVALGACFCLVAPAGLRRGERAGHAGFRRAVLPPMPSPASPS